MIIDNATPLRQELIAFFAIGVPAVLGAWILAYVVIQALSPEKSKPRFEGAYVSIQRWLFLGRTPFGVYASPGRIARFRLMARTFRYFPALLLALWGIRIILRLIQGT